MSGEKVFLSVFIGFLFLASAGEPETIQAKACQFNDNFKYEEVVSNTKVFGKISDKAGFQGAKMALETLTQKGYSVKPLERSKLQEGETYSEIGVLCQATAQYTNGQFRYECYPNIQLFSAGKNRLIYTPLNTIMKSAVEIEMRSYEYDKMWNSIAELVNRLPSCKVIK